MINAFIRLLLPVLGHGKLFCLNGDKYDVRENRKHNTNYKLPSAMKLNQISFHVTLDCFIID